MNSTFSQLGGAVLLSGTSLWHLFLALPVITQWAVMLLVVCGAIAHVFKFTERTVHDGPSIFTTAGIFFTFLGIAQGLYGFDPQQIDASIPTLLEGLKTAFIASVAGVGLALSIKLRFALFGVKHEASLGPSDEATVNDLYNQMGAIQKALVGGEDSSLLTQIKLGRQDNNDRLDELMRSQSDFMKRMADNNSKALIQALQEVIRDFNTKISEQFGENFKKLNEAVGKLLEWQEGYRQTLSEMIAQQSQTSQNMALATDRYSAVVERAETFAAISNQLSKTLTTLNQQQVQLDTSLTSFAQLLSSASSSLPQIEQKIMQLTEQMTFGVNQHQTLITQALNDGTTTLNATVADTKSLLLESVQKARTEINEHIKELFDSTKENINQLTKQMTFGVNEHSEEITKAVRDGAVNLHAAVSDTKSILATAIQTSNTQINDHVRHLADKTTEQISKLDVALENELAKSISSLGRQLTALSKQFVDDYGPLTDKLRQVVRIAERT